VHEAPQVLGLPRLAAGCDHLPGAHIEGREDRLRAVPRVLPFPTRAAAWPAWPPTDQGAPRVTSCEPLEPSGICSNYCKAQRLSQEEGDEDLPAPSHRSRRNP
jgi:hypothetical protein